MSKEIVNHMIFQPAITRNKQTKRIICDKYKKRPSLSTITYNARNNFRSLNLQKGQIASQLGLSGTRIFLYVIYIRTRTDFHRHACKNSTKNIHMQKNHQILASINWTLAHFCRNRIFAKFSVFRARDWIPLFSLRFSFANNLWTNNVDWLKLDINLFRLNWSALQKQISLEMVQLMKSCSKSTFFARNL